VDLRAAAKTSAIEDQQDLLEEHAVASTLLGLPMTLEPEPDSPSSEAKRGGEEEAWHNARSLRATSKRWRGKRTAVDEEDYLTAAEIKRSIAELVQQREALERAVNEEDKQRSSAAAGPE